MAFLVFASCWALYVLLMTAEKPKHHDHFVTYRHRCVRIGEVPPVEVAQLN